jgi:hypothetical protein
MPDILSWLWANSCPQDPNNQMHLLWQPKEFHPLLLPPQVLSVIHSKNAKNLTKDIQVRSFLGMMALFKLLWPNILYQEFKQKIPFLFLNSSKSLRATISLSKICLESQYYTFKNGLNHGKKRSDFGFIYTFQNQHVKSNILAFAKFYSDIWEARKHKICMAGSEGLSNIPLYPP